MIHQFQMNSHYVVLDVSSGALHDMDELSYRLIGRIDKEGFPEELQTLMPDFPGYSEAELSEALEEIHALTGQGLLFSPDQTAAYAENMGLSPVKALCLHIAHDCNLRCGYCFASTGDFGEGRKLMPLETGKLAIDLLIRESGARRNLEVDFFGGEPLMNFETVKGIVAYARSQEKEHNKNFRFTITTNGMLLDDEKIEYINREMSNVVLSLDGRKEVNDRVRCRVDGSGSYDAILGKFLKVAQARAEAKKDYYVRGTFTKLNLDFSQDVFHLYHQGFDQISVEPVVCAPDSPFAITEKELDVVCGEYEDLAMRILEDRKSGGYFNFFHFMVDLEGGPCVLKRLRGCGCGNEYLAVTPDGDLYPCHQFVGLAQWKMGNVHQGSFDLEKKAYFSKTNVYHKEQCTQCWARFFCSGGCNANNYQYAGDVLRPHEISCVLQKKRLECALMLKAALAQEGCSESAEPRETVCC